MISSTVGKTSRPDGRRAAGSSVSPTANLAVEGITNRPNRESRNARKLGCTPGFLAKSITCSGQIIAIDQSLPNSSRTTGYRLRFPAVASQGESIRSQLAVFLHDKHSRTADPLGKAREMPEPDSLGG